MKARTLILLILACVLAACASPTPTPTPAPTSIPPTAVPKPTVVPPTPTPYPTYTPLPTYTVVPTVTATRIPPTATLVPPSATPQPTRVPSPAPTSEFPAGMGALSSTNFIGGGLDVTLTVNGKSYVVPNANNAPNNKIVIYLPPGNYVFSATIPRRSAVRCELLNGCTVEIRAGQYTILDWN